MADKPHPFDSMMGGQSHHDRMAARSSVTFEEGKVNYILGMFKLNVRKAGNALRRVEERESGQSHLTLRAFNAVNSSFPMLLGATRLGGMQLHTEASAMIPSLFKEFGGAPFVSAYEKFYEENEPRASGRTVGLIFPRKGFRNGLVIYTTDDPQVIPLSEREGFFTYVSGKKKNRHWIIVRSFQKTLEAIHNAGHGWRPDAVE